MNSLNVVNKIFEKVLSDCLIFFVSIRYWLFCQTYNFTSFCLFCSVLKYLLDREHSPARDGSAAIIDITLDTEHYWLEFLESLSIPVQYILKYMNQYGCRFIIK